MEFFDAVKNIRQKNLQDILPAHTTNDSVAQTKDLQLINKGMVVNEEVSMIIAFYKVKFYSNYIMIGPEKVCCTKVELWEAGWSLFWCCDDVIKIV